MTNRALHLALLSLAPLVGACTTAPTPWAPPPAPVAAPAVGIPAPVPASAPPGAVGGAPGVAPAATPAAPAAADPLALLRGNWVRRSTTRGSAESLTFEPDGRFGMHLPNGRDVTGTYTFVSGAANDLVVMMNLELRTLTLRVRHAISVAPDGTSITVTSENTPNEHDTYQRASSPTAMSSPSTH